MHIMNRIDILECTNTSCVTTHVHPFLSFSLFGRYYSVQTKNRRFPSHSLSPPPATLSHFCVSAVSKISAFCADTPKLLSRGIAGPTKLAPASTT